jgi:nitrate reductase NapAB chaperone NapD
MPIKSYLAYPFNGKKDSLVKEIISLEHCEVIPSENEDIIVVVTDTLTIEEDKKLKDTIDALEHLKMISLVSGFNTPKTN